MHEAGIALEILRLAEKAAAEEAGSPPARLVKLRVAVGEFSGVDPSLLKTAWTAVVAEGRSAEAELEVRWCPVHRHCPACGEDKSSSQGSWMQLCPDCDAPITVEGGQELDLESVEFESSTSPSRHV